MRQIEPHRAASTWTAHFDNFVTYTSLHTVVQAIAACPFILGTITPNHCEIERRTGLGAPRPGCRSTSDGS